MKKITKEELKTIIDRHAVWIADGAKENDKRKANLRGANLRHSDLRYSDLRYSDLRGANWDYSSNFTLSCKGSRFKTDINFIKQVLAHLCTLSVDVNEQEEWETIRNAILPYARQSHRAADLGLLIKEGVENG